MRKLITILAASLLTTGIYAQCPQKMSYQAVIRNSSNALVTSAPVGMKISILQGTTTGTPVYVETQIPHTNSNGLATLEIGGGTIVSGTFTGINWGAGPYFIKTETDPLGGTSYTITGTSQLLSVPYALYAVKAGNAPTVSTTAASAVLSNSATLNGLVNANGFISTVSFEYGTTTAYGNTVQSTPNTVSGNSNISVSYNLTGLLSNTTYHYRVKSLNALDNSYGNDLTFTTISLPIVVTTAAETANNPSFILHGNVDAKGVSTTVTFEYGGSTAYSYAHSIAATPSTVTSNGTYATVSATVTGLMPGENHFRVKAVNANGTTYGSDMSMFVNALAYADSSYSINPTTFLLRGHINPNGLSTSVIFEYGTTTSYGSSIATTPSTVTGTASILITANVTGLMPHTTYYFRIKGVNANGIIYSSSNDSWGDFTTP